MKIRAGGLKEYEQRVLDGDVRAMRALVRQAYGPNTLDMPFQNCELRASADGTGGTRLKFTGYASTVEDPYTMTDWLGDYTEIMRDGAFKQTLSMNPDVIFCLNHNWEGAPMARTKAGTLQISADSTGQLCEADLDGKRADVYQVQSAMDAGELDAMSLAFYVIRQVWSPDFEQRDILEVDLDGGDNSVVTWPANPGTTGTTALRKRAAQALARSRVPALIIERARTEKRAGATLSAATMEVLSQVATLLDDAGDAMDTARPILAELMGTSDSSSSSEQQSSGPDPEMIRARQRLLVAASK